MQPNTLGVRWMNTCSPTPRILAGCLHTVEVLKAELQKIVLALHPDKTGGEFQRDSDKARFMKARRAVELLNAGRADDEFLDGTPLPGAPRALGDASTRSTWQESAARLHMSAMADARERISRRLADPKRASGLATVVMMAVVLLADWLAQNPVLGPLLENPLAATVLVAMTCLGAAAFLTLWLVERAAVARVEHLMSEAALGQIFIQARICADRSGRPSQLSGFDIRRGIEVLVSRRRSRLQSRVPWGLSAPLDSATLGSISAIQTQRLLERRVIREVHTPSIEILYEVSPLAPQV